MASQSTSRILVCKNPGIKESVKYIQSHRNSRTWHIIQPTRVLTRSSFKTYQILFHDLSWASLEGELHSGPFHHSIMLCIVPSVAQQKLCNFCLVLIIYMHIYLINILLYKSHTVYYIHIQVILKNCLEKFLL